MTEVFIILLCVSAVAVDAYGAVRSAMTYSWGRAAGYTALLILFGLALYAILGEAIV